MRQPPILTPRIEETLLPPLRQRYPDVVFGGLRSRDNPGRECVLVGEPQGMATPVSQYVRLRMSVIVRRADGSGDYAAAQHLASHIIADIMEHAPGGPIISVSLESGPMRQSDGDLIFAYSILLLQACTIQ